MNATKLLALGLLVLGLFGMVGMASAIDVTDGGDGVIFSGENVTIANWTNCSTRDYNFLWIIDSVSKKAWLGLNTSDNVTDGYNVGVQKCSYTVSTNNLTAGSSGLALFHVYVRATNDATSPNINASAVDRDISFQLNNYTITVLPDADAEQGAIPGDNVTVYINTTGNASADVRAGATFTVSTTESGTSPVLASTDVVNGNLVYSILATSTVSDRNNVTVIQGITNRTDRYMVRKFNIQAYDRVASSSDINKVVLEALDANGTRANINNSQFGTLIFNLTISGRTNDNWGNVSANYTLYNVTFAANANLSTVGTSWNVSSDVTTTGTITANCANFTLTDSDTYTVRAANENITITGTYYNVTAQRSFYITQNFTVSGWINSTTTNVSVNISFYNGTGYKLLYTVNDTTPAADGTWNVTFNTSDNVNFNISTWANAANTFLPGQYAIIARRNDSQNKSATWWINLTDTLTIDTANSTLNVTSYNDSVYIDYLVTIQGSSSRINNSNILINITGPSDNVNASLTTPVFGAVQWGTNGTYRFNWNASVNATGTYTVLVSTGASNATKTITVMNNFTENIPATAPTGSAVNLSGTSTRTPGTVFNVSVVDPQTGIQIITATFNVATVGSNQVWSYMWNTTTTGKADGSALPTGTYTVTVSDNVTSVTKSVSVISPTVTVDMPTSAYVDQGVNMTFTTDLAAGTALQINITNCSGGNMTGGLITDPWEVTINATGMATLHFVPSTNLSGDAHLLNWFKTNTTISTGSTNICFAIGNSTYTTSATLNVLDTLALTTQSQAVSNDTVLLTGTSARQNGTKVTVYVTSSGGIYNISNIATIEKQSNVTYATGTFTNNTYNTTTTGDATGNKLAAGTYTIYANDSFMTVSKTLTVLDTGTITITTPTANQNISIGDQFVITGTSNRANNTAVTVTVSGTNGTTLNTNVNVTGLWNATWNTTGYTAGQYIIVASQSTDTAATVIAQLIVGATTTTTTTTTQAGETTTTTTQAGECVLAGNSAPCDEVSLEEAVDGITAWSNDEMSLADVVALINAWATGVAT